MAASLRPAAAPRPAAPPAVLAPLHRPALRARRDAAARQARNSSARGRRSTGTSGSTPKEEPVWFEPRIEVGFDVPPPKTSAIALNLATSMGTTKAGSRFGGVRVAVDGQTAILRGIVASQNDRQLAEQITLLEPSIVSVRNELVIQRRATAPAGSR